MEYNYSEADTFTCLIQPASGSWDSKATQKPQTLLLSEAGHFNLRLWVCPHHIFCMCEGKEQCCICFAFACVCVVLSEAEWCKLYEHNGLQKPITGCFLSKMGMLQYLETAHTSATSREGQACFNLALPDCYGNTVLTTSYRECKYILLDKLAQNPVLHNGSLIAQPSEDRLHGNAFSNKVSSPPSPQSYL